VQSTPNKAIKQENLQLAVFTAFNILASYKFLLIEALGRKAFGSRLAKNKHTSQEDIIATLLRHNDNETNYNYVEESTGVIRVLNDMYANL